MQTDERIRLLRHRHALKQVLPKGVGSALHTFPSCAVQHLGPVTGSGAVTSVQDLLEVKDLTGSRVHCGCYRGGVQIVQL